MFVRRIPSRLALRGVGGACVCLGCDCSLTACAMSAGAHWVKNVCVCGHACVCACVRVCVCVPVAKTKRQGRIKAMHILIMMLIMIVVDHNHSHGAADDGHDHELSGLCFVLWAAIACLCKVLMGRRSAHGATMTSIAAHRGWALRKATHKLQVGDALHRSRAPQHSCPAEPTCNPPTRNVIFHNAINRA